MEKINFIVIRHSILESITEKEVESAISKNFPNVGKVIQCEVKPIERDSIPHAEIKDINWGLAAFKQEEIFKNKIEPILEKNKDFKILYFGTAPIPLAIHLGSKFGTWKRIDVFLRNHKGEKEWYWNIGDLDFELEDNGNKIPNEDFSASGDVLLRIASSYKIDEEETSQAIETEIIKEIDIAASPLMKDLSSSKQAILIADKFEDAFDKVLNHLKNVDTIHVIATVPVGLAFLLGTKMSANISPTIQAYQYYRNADIKYDAVLKINSDLNLFTPLTEDENKYAQDLKEDFNNNIWSQLQSLIDNEDAQKSNIDKWYKLILQKKSEHRPLNTNRWNQMDFLSNTPLKGTSFGSKDVVDGGFKFDAKNDNWEIDNHLILGVSNKLENNKDRVFRALRMLLLHEGAHYWLHGLNDATAQDIGRFPKILEEVDYQADVWAMLYDYSFTKLFSRKDISDENVNHFFANTIKVAIATMWSFDDEGVRLSEIQIRRLNRYLIWYWQLNRLENTKDKSLKNVVEILSNPPLIELKGLFTKAEGERVFYRLNNFEKSNLEIGVLWKNKIIRTGNLGFFRIEDLIEGFRNRDSSKISELIRGLFMQVSLINS